MQTYWFRRSWRRLWAGMSLLLSVLVPGALAQSKADPMLIDNFSNGSLISQLGTQWRGVSDNVMGGISQATIAHMVQGEENCLRLTGEVRLENNGGFIQAALALTRDGGTLDASKYSGIRLTVQGNDERYSVHLRTTDNTRPWQSYRAHFMAGREAQSVDIPFSKFEPYRIETPLDVTKLRRIGLVAIGRQFEADLQICRVEFYE